MTTSLESLQEGWKLTANQAGPAAAGPRAALQHGASLDAVTTHLKTQT